MLSALLILALGQCPGGQCARPAPSAPRPVVAFQAAPVAAYAYAAPVACSTGNCAARPASVPLVRRRGGLFGWRR